MYWNDKSRTESFRGEAFSMESGSHEKEQARISICHPSNMGSKQSLHFCSKNTPHEKKRSSVLLHTSMGEIR